MPFLKVEISFVLPSSFVPGHSSFLLFSAATFPFFRPSSLVIRHSSLVITSSFFRLETPFLVFLALLYYSMNQLLIYPSYINRPRFV